MRLPNGDGGVSKLPGNRRRPWRARVTIGWEYSENKVVQKYKTVGYYATKSEALRALYTYNGHTPDKKKVYPTFKELYEEWLDKISAELSKGMRYAKMSAFKFYEPIYNIPVNEINLSGIQQIFNRSNLSTNILHNHKTALKQVLEYAIKSEILEPSFIDFLRYIDVKVGKKPKKNEKSTIPLEVISDLWRRFESKKDNATASVLVLLYTGMRTKEYLNLLISDVDFKEGVIHIRQAKTKAGIRTIPIHSKIAEVLKWQCSNNNNNVFSEHLTYTQYYTRYWPLKDHTPHECRHTFISTMARLGAPQLIVQRIVGHKGHSITENVYTHIATPEMRNALELLSYNYTK